MRVTGKAQAYFLARPELLLEQGRAFFWPSGPSVFQEEHQGGFLGKQNFGSRPFQGRVSPQRQEQKQRVGKRDLPPGCLFTPSAWKASQRALSLVPTPKTQREEEPKAQWPSWLLCPLATSLERGLDGSLRREGPGPTQSWVLCGGLEWWRPLIAGRSGKTTRPGHCLLLGPDLKLGRVVPSRCLRKEPASLLSAGSLGFSPPAKSFVWLGAVRLCHRGLPSSFSQPLPPPLTSFSLFSLPWMGSHRPQLQRKELLPLPTRLPASPQVARTSLSAPAPGSCI